MRVGFSTTRQRVHTERLLHRFFTVSQLSLSLETIQRGKKKKNPQSPQKAMLVILLHVFLPIIVTL